MRDIIFTNNISVKESYKNDCLIEFVDGSVLDVLEKTRNFIHKGHKLLSHPLAGSVKPNENPFKSILLCGTAGCLDFDSLRIIENSIITAKSFPVRWEFLPDNIAADFRLVDHSLITSALNSKIK